MCCAAASLQPPAVRNRQSTQAPRAPPRAQAMNRYGPGGLTPLQAACQAGSVPCVKLLLAAGANPSQLDRTECFSSLHLAARAGHLGVIEALLSERFWVVTSSAAQGGEAEKARLFLAVSRPRLRRPCVGSCWPGWDGAVNMPGPSWLESGACDCRLHAQSGLAVNVWPVG